MATKGAAFLVGRFDANGKLMHVVKYLNHDIFFDFAYSYYPNGRIKRVMVTGNGRTTVFEYDADGRQSPAGFW